MNKITFLGFFAAASLPILAQTPQIPTLQVCNSAGPVVTTSGTPQLKIPSRASGIFTGTVNVLIRVVCDATTGFPSGSVVLSNYSMNDPNTQATISSVVQIDQVTSTGFVDPTVYISGLCIAQEQPTPGGPSLTVPCHYWIMVADTGGTNASTVGGPTIVSFLVVDKNGKRLAYGTGPVTSGSGVITVTPTSN